MTTTVAILLTIIIVMVVILWRGNNYPNERVVDSPELIAVGPDSVYDYGYSYTDSPYYVPAYSYGTTREYKLRHGRHTWTPQNIHSPAQHARNIGHMSAGGHHRSGFKAPKIPSFVPPMGRPMPLPHSYSLTTSPIKPMVVRASG